MAEVRLPQEDDYPNNSNVLKDREVERDAKPKKEPTKVTKGKVTQRKKPFGRRFAEAFGAQDGQGVFDYIIYDIIIPATKNMIVDSIIDGAEMAILGETRSRRRRPSDRGSTRYAYDRVSYRDRDRRWNDRDRYEDRRTRSNLRDYEDIVFDSKADAEEVISGLIEIIDVSGQATVLDLYDLSGLKPVDYAVGNYGWTNLSTATTERTRDGYVLYLPKATLLR